jgi:hypothetical protein
VGLRDWAGSDSGLAFPNESGRYLGGRAGLHCIEIRAAEAFAACCGVDLAVGIAVGAGIRSKEFVGCVFPKWFWVEYFCAGGEGICIDIWAAEESAACCGMNLAGGSRGFVQCEAFWSKGC